MLRLLLVLLVAATAFATNPTRYGPVGSPEGLGCWGDETYTNSGPYNSLSICVPWGPPVSLGCSQDSDCPTNVPPGVSFQPYCKGSIPGGNNGTCVLQCSSDSDCDNDNNGICRMDPHQGTPDGKLCTYIRPVPDGCYYIAAMDGRWVQISSSSGKQEVKYEYGMKHDYTGTDANTWGASATTTAEAGFSAFGASGKVSVSGTVSATVSKSYSATFSQSSTTTYTYDFDAGVVWQWQWTINDGCGKSIGSGHDLALTDGAFDPPCCLPGFSTNITDPHGSCHGDSPNLCKDTTVL